ncbi:MAG: V-type ATP synthase subunit D [Propionibacteriales bacterium]|nr:V-type ATP synthase subunit D [Propionibacteriales bacterium]
MQTLVATRSELLARRSRAVFAEQGRDLLQDKRTALVREFRRHGAELLSGLEHLRTLAVEARERLDDAVAVCGQPTVRSGALAAAAGVEADVRSRTVAGVLIIELDHGPVRRGVGTRGWASTVTPARLDSVASAYEDQLQLLLDLCAVELSVRREATEIARTTKQVNALENIVIPQLREEARRISLTLDEREREGHARLKRAMTRRLARGST